jgi:hypothetical protein
MDYFYALTKITIGDGRKACFWNSPWADGIAPKFLAPSIYAISKRKKWSVRNALLGNAWVAQFDLSNGLNTTHIEEFVRLWRFTSTLRLNDEVHDSIVWKVSTSGSYSSASAYKAHFTGSTVSTMNGTIWKVWAPPKCKFFSWLILQNRVWTADRLHRRGWPNCGNCLLCNSAPETAAHLMFKCRYSRRVWSTVKDWLGLHDFEPSEWDNFEDVKTWWLHIVHAHPGRRKAVATLVMLVSWELWNERNARVFKHKSSMATATLDRIKFEARSWSFAGAKFLGHLMPGD